MSTKKSTTKSRPRASTTATPTSRPHNRRVSPDPAAELAEHISAILKHPDTPTRIYNALADEVSSLDAPKGYFDSAEYIEVCFRRYFASRRKGNK